MWCYDKSYDYHSQKVAETDGSIDNSDTSFGCNSHNSLNFVVLASTVGIQANPLVGARKAS
jgi:hypothetical protein